MLELETSRHIWVQRDQAAEGSAVDRHCPCSPCRTNKLKKQKKANKNKKNHRPVDSAERVHSRTAESSSFTVITKTDLLATWAFQCFNLSFAWDEMIVEKNCNYWHCTAGETSWSWTLETASSSLHLPSLIIMVPTSPAWSWSPSSTALCSSCLCLKVKRLRWFVFLLFREFPCVDSAKDFSEPAELFTFPTGSADTTC